MPKHNCSATWEEVGWRDQDTGAAWEMKIKQFIRRNMYDYTEDDIMRAIMRGSRGTANPSVVRQHLKEQFAFKEEKSNA
jgi:hypothetical protein